MAMVLMKLDRSLQSRAHRWITGSEDKDRAVQLLSAEAHCFHRLEEVLPRQLGELGGAESLELGWWKSKQTSLWARLLIL